MLQYVMAFVCFVLGGPGNILSAIVWLRRHVASKNSSALYLAVLAINDLVFLLSQANYSLVPDLYRVAYGSWLYYCIETASSVTASLEPLLVLGFSVERLIAISSPLQVGLRCMHLQLYSVCSLYEARSCPP